MTSWPGQKKEIIPLFGLASWGNRPKKMAEKFSVKTLKISFDDISKSADIQSWQLVATDVQSLSASMGKSCCHQLMIVVNLSFRLGFSTEGWSWMKPARHLLMQDVIKIDVKSLPRDSSLCTLLYPGVHTLILVSPRALPAYLAHPQAYRIRRALQNLCCTPNNELLTRIVNGSNWLYQEWLKNAVISTPTQAMPARSSTSAAGGDRALCLVLANSGGRCAPSGQ